MTAKYILIGKPLGHSFSAQWFNEYFCRHGIDAVYENVELDDVSSLLPLLREHPEICGLNVTSPYKRDVVPLLTSMTAEARAVGAVNCIRVSRNADGSVELKGHNSDVEGFAAMLSWLQVKSGADGDKALIFGTGGASSAVAYALRNAGIGYTVVSRNPERGLPYDALSDSMLRDHRLLINATTLGMGHHADECVPIDYDAVTTHHICLDLIYNPAVTLFMRRCAAKGAIVRNGLTMLIAQAQASYRFWTR